MAAVALAVVAGRAMAAAALAVVTVALANPLTLKNRSQKAFPKCPILINSIT